MTGDARAALLAAKEDAAASVMALRAAEVLRAEVLELAGDPRIAQAVASLAEDLAAVPGVDRRSPSTG